MAQSSSRTSECRYTSESRWVSLGISACDPNPVNRQVGQSIFGLGFEFVHYALLMLASMFMICVLVLFSRRFSYSYNSSCNGEFPSEPVGARWLDSGFRPYTTMLLLVSGSLTFRGPSYSF